MFNPFRVVIQFVLPPPIALGVIQIQVLRTYNPTEMQEEQFYSNNTMCE